jgi:DNA-binding CsgD family transcriptional regulator
MDKETFEDKKLIEFESAIRELHSKHFGKSFSEIKSDLDVLSNQMLESVNCFFVVDFNTQDYVQTSSNTKELLGIDSEEFVKGGIGVGLNLFIPLHRALMVENILPEIFECLKKVKDQDLFKKLNISYQTIIRFKDGTDRWVLHQIKILSLSELGFPRLGVKTLIDISSIKTDVVIHLEVSYFDDDGDRIHLVSKYFNPNKSSIDISCSELRVLKQISEGKSSKQIANDLCLSLHTINNHRKNMLKKNSMQSSTELVTMALKSGLV